MPITAIYSPDLTRNLDTVRPLASRLGTEITRTAGVSVFAADSIAREILDRTRAAWSSGSATSRATCR
jgi:broad specificity phosphatase PhoE